MGIVASFTALGLALAVFVGAAGVAMLAGNPWVNLLLTAVFVGFALNLFGAYQIAIPSAWLTALDGAVRRQGAAGKSVGVLGALLMGLTFTLTSFTCTAPFVGTVLVTAAQGQWQQPLVGMLVYWPWCRSGSPGYRAPAVGCNRPKWSWGSSSSRRR